MRTVGRRGKLRIAQVIGDAALDARPALHGLPLPPVVDRLAARTRQVASELRLSTEVLVNRAEVRRRVRHRVHAIAALREALRFVGPHVDVAHSRGAGRRPHPTSTGTASACCTGGEAGPGRAAHTADLEVGSGREVAHAATVVSLRASIEELHEPRITQTVVSNRGRPKHLGRSVWEGNVIYRRGDVRVIDDGLQLGQARDPPTCAESGAVALRGAPSINTRVDDLLPRQLRRLIVDHASSLRPVVRRETRGRGADTADLFWVPDGRDARGRLTEEADEPGGVRIGGISRGRPEARG